MDATWRSLRDALRETPIAVVALGWRRQRARPGHFVRRHPHGGRRRECRRRGSAHEHALRQLHQLRSRAACRAPSRPPGLWRLGYGRADQVAASKCSIGSCANSLRVVRSPITKRCIGCGLPQSADAAQAVAPSHAAQRLRRREIGHDRRKRELASRKRAPVRAAGPPALSAQRYCVVLCLLIAVSLLAGASGSAPRMSWTVSSRRARSFHR